MCELCGFDAAYYGDDVRPFERLNICFGCYVVDMLGFTREQLTQMHLRGALRREFRFLGSDITA